jgi:pimeloyl-ACP methyl ester carboxylesterase
MKSFYNIEKVITKDNITLFGYYAASVKKDANIVLINIHGTAGTFYSEEFEKYYVEKLPKLGLGVIFTNNRGAGLLDPWTGIGAATEKFEDCLIDIDAWIEFALTKGYTKIILQGHSLGTEKVVYYMNKGKYKDKVISIILLAFSDSYGTQQKHLKNIKIDLMKEAKQLVKINKKDTLLSSYWLSHAGVLPQSAESYINFFSENSELSNALPLRNGKNLEYYKNIRVPILGVIGDQEEYTIIPIIKAIDLLKKENSKSTIIQIFGANHDFVNKQDILINNVISFIQKNNYFKFKKQ